MLHIINIGNIGSGKTSFSTELTKTIPKSHLVEEPLDMPSLGTFLHDMDNKKNFPSKINDIRYSNSTYSFQMRMLSDRFSNLSNQLNNKKNRVVVSDQGLLFDKVFAHIHEAEFTKDEFKMYMFFYNTMLKRCERLISRTIVIYLDETPETCLKRIKKRGRPNESSYTIEYLQALKDDMDMVVKEMECDYEVIRLKIPDLEPKEHSEYIADVYEKIEKNVVYSIEDVANIIKPYVIMPWNLPVKFTGKTLVTYVGNVGVGKSTVSKKLFDTIDGGDYLIEDIPFEILKTYIPIITNPESTKQEKEESSLSFQNEIARRKIKNLMNTKSDIVIQDQSIYSDVVFAEGYNTLNGLDCTMSIQRDVMEKHLDICEKFDNIYIVYLKESVDTLMKRIANRARKGEDSYPREVIEFFDKLMCGMYGTR